MRLPQFLRYSVILAILGTVALFLFRSSDVYERYSSARNLAGTPSPLGSLPPAAVQASPQPSGAPALTSDEAINIRVYQEVSPGVVNITSRVVEYDFFFNAVPQEGSGTGAIIDNDGNIVTNYHVIEGADQLEVTLPDQTKWRPTLVGQDPDNDLAVIRIKAPRDKLHPVRFGDSNSLRVGQKVLAIGNPFRMHNTLTTGIVSSLGRTIRAPNGTMFEDIIQTDAGLNPGNSGGPLLNSAGEMIGVNTMIFSPSGGNIGLGFAIPASRVKRITADLLQYGQVRRPTLGVSYLYTITPDLAEMLELKVEHGVHVSQVQSDGPADRAGVKGGTRRVRFYNQVLIIGGDIITAVNEKPVTSVEDLRRILDGLQPGDTINLDVDRQGRKQRLRVTLGSSLTETRRRF